MDRSRNQSPNDIERLQQDDIGHRVGGGHPHLHHDDDHQPFESNNMFGALPQPQPQLHRHALNQQRLRPPPDTNSHSHHYHRNARSSSSHSTDTRLPPSMDPTGMFRNRGRRVIAAGGRNSPHTSSAVGTTSSASSTAQLPPSPPKYHNQRHRSRDPFPNNRNTKQNIHSNADQRNYDMRYNHGNVASSAIVPSQPLRINSRPDMPQGSLLHYNSSTRQPNHTTTKSSPQMGSILRPLQDNDNHPTEANHRIDDHSQHHVERIMKKEEPEKDHPPQSLLPHDDDNHLFHSNSVSCITQNDINETNRNNSQQSPNFNNNESPNNHSDEHDTAQLNSYSNILLESQDSSEREHHARSPVGSTVSVMGSVIGEDGDDNNCDETRLRAVQRRMMQDVQEVLEEENDEGVVEEEEDTRDDSGNDCEKESTNWIAAAPQEKKEDATISDSVQDDNDNDDIGETLNVSLEVSFHKDTSFMDDHPDTNDAIPRKEDEFREGDEDSYSGNDDASNNVVKVADFSKPYLDNAINNFHNGAFNNNGNNNSIHNDTLNNESSRKKAEQESPFRAAGAAFRRSLPPLSSSSTSESLKQRLTPKKFDRVSASSAIDKAASTASLLVGQCFSFEDTTIDDNDFLAAMPNVLQQHQLGGEGGNGGGPGHSSAPSSHNYYGFSAVASFDTGSVSNAKTDGAAVAQNIIMETSTLDGTHSASMKRNGPKWHPPPPHQRTRLSYVKPDSPFRVIRQTQTWDHHNGQSLPVRQQQHLNSKYRNGDLRQTSSFDPWSPPLLNGNGRTKSLQLDLSCGLDGQDGKTHDGKDDPEIKDWKKTETERGEAIDLLACIVETSLNFNETDKNKGFHDLLCEKCQGKCDKNSMVHFNSCDDCLEKLKRVANSMKQHEDNPSDSEHGDQLRSIAIDTLLRSHEFALEFEKSSLKAKKWLESIGSAKDVITDEETDESSDSPDLVALRARLHSAENTISTQDADFKRLNEELSNCREEIGRLKSASRTQTQHHGLSMSAQKSMLSNSSSDDSVVEKSGSLVLRTPRTTVKPCDSQDESFTKWEKSIDMQMNLESRKEILFLKAALERANRKISALEQPKDEQKAEPFASEIEPIQASNDDGDSEQLFMKIAEDIENEALDLTVYDADGIVNEDVKLIPSIKLNDPVLEKELADYRTALIASLRVEELGSRAHADSITSSDDPDLEHDFSKSKSSEIAPDQKMVNVRMIDAENFSTEWDLAPALPPPPDHGLQSPIVDAILSKWTDDIETRSALVKWIEDILDGSNVDAMPSLKLSGLDHQIRDGFFMHILPLLLRRRDVHVHLTSRAHRQTTYDIAVRVTPTSFGAHNDENEKGSDVGSGDPESQYRKMSQESKHHLMAFQATRSGASIKESYENQMSPNKPKQTTQFLGRSIPNLVRSSSNAGSISTAVTSPISNRTPSRVPQIHGRNNRYTSLTEMRRGDTSFTHDQSTMPNLMSASPSLGDELSVGSSVDDDSDSKQSQRQSSIMGSISGAFGLLSRRKPSPSENEFQVAMPKSNNEGHSSMFHTPKRESSQKMPQLSKEEEHSYHRVVSAPPGKIGITFVEYRGHAMVSNVSEDSPLVGWVFPSDVLIAIDDVSVSGLRTREIVKLLTNKVGQQRNLRMVSGVAMNELTRPGTV